MQIGFVQALYTWCPGDIKEFYRITYQSCESEICIKLILAIIESEINYV